MRRRYRFVLAGAAAAALLWLAVPSGFARADTPTPTPTPTPSASPTPTPTPSASPTPSRSPTRKPLKKLVPLSPTRKPRTALVSPSPPPESTSCSLASPFVPPPEPPPPPYVLPEPAGATTSMSTAAVDSVAQQLARTRHISLRRAYLAVAGPFPVAGPAHWSNDWHAFRPCPWPHLHVGLDIFAAWGTPLVAVADGIISSRVNNGVSGLGLQLTAADGMKYFYAHLSAFSSRTVEGRNVKEGQVLGYVGNTGDAAGGPTHLHLQAEPDGIPMPPKPLVDRWVQKEAHRAQMLLTKARKQLRHALKVERAHAPAIELRQPAVAPYRPGYAPIAIVHPRLSPRPASMKGRSVLPMTAVGAIVALLLLGLALRWRARRRPDPASRTSRQEGGLEEAWLGVAARLQRTSHAIESGHSSRASPGP
jgi:murein DD-endopeptidase MepM/ murein hydrolase activator NlpD